MSTQNTCPFCGEERDEDELTCGGDNCLDALAEDSEAAEREHRREMARDDR